MTIAKIGAIALNTWRETMRDRLMAAVLAVLSLALAAGLGFEGASRPEAVLDLGLTIMGGLGTVVAIFLGTSLMHKELDRRTVYVVLTKPISRFQFLAGKYLGLMATLTLMTAAMGLILSALMAGLGRFDLQIWAVVAALWMQLGLVTAMAFCFSTVTSGVLAALYTGGFFLVGMQTHVIREFADSEVLLNPANFWLGQLLFCVLPNFSAFDHKNAVLYGHHLAWAPWAYGLAYGALLSAGFLVMASVAWEARELP